jgi:ribosomal protein S12 methylthiotransferase
MLRRMRRGHGGKRLYGLVDTLRSAVPDLVFRTAFIVGHPGESDADFDELRRFVEWAEFDRVGVFHYSDEPTADSHGMDAKVTRSVARRRARALMKLQRGISRKKNRLLVGRELDVLVEGTSSESELVFVGRHAGQAPEIDGSVYLSGGEVRPGKMRRVRVVRATDYDLLGDVVDEDDDVLPAAPRGRGKPRRTPEAPLVHRASDGRRVTLRTVP